MGIGTVMEVYGERKNSDYLKHAQWKSHSVYSQAKSQLLHPSGFPLSWNSPLHYWYISNKGMPAFNMIGLFSLACQSGL